MLPFELTAGQLAVAEEISADVSRPHPMNRLLQGEVGSGKTIVALRAMLQVVDAGYQCALLAPTEVLAAQHARSLTHDARRSGVGRRTRSARTRDPRDSAHRLDAYGRASGRRCYEAVTGDAGIVIGTHALIQDNVKFFDLGLVVVDEQHRFGVEQRDSLRSRGRDGASPHVLVMTATPIPRTIAMTVLGDLEVSTLRELPRGRSPIVSRVVPAKVHPTWVDRAWERIREEVADGRQAYVVCSRIGDGDTDEDLPVDPGEQGAAPAGKSRARASGAQEPPETTSVLELHEMLASGPLRDLNVGLLHGRLPADDKDAVMREFNDGAIDVLVCTTVVEVGVDVPNATVMVIVDADRFGVSQLHQLRGRVGRGGHQGLCLLVTDTKPGSPDDDPPPGGRGNDRRVRTRATRPAVAPRGRCSGQGAVGHGDHAASAFARRRRGRHRSRPGVRADRHRSDPGLREHPGLASMVTAALDTESIEYLDKS